MGFTNHTTFKSGLTIFTICTRCLKNIPCCMIEFFFFFFDKKKKKMFRHPVYPSNMTKQRCSPVEWQYFIYHHYIITISQYKSNSKTPTLLGLNVWRTIWDVGEGQLVVVVGRQDGQDNPEYVYMRKIPGIGALLYSTAPAATNKAQNMPQALSWYHRLSGHWTTICCITQD